MAQQAISKERLTAHLRASHSGRAEGVTVGRLAKELTDMPSTAAVERQLRHMVVELRIEGVPICACPSQGYFMATTSQELEDTCRNLHDRAMTSLRQVSGLKNKALPDIAGQLGLDAKPQESL